jgi:deoxyribodipyrimidine photo-lyase
MRTVIWWLRRDLRLADNQALTAALENGEQIIPLFILDPVLRQSEYVGAKRLAFLYAGLADLDRSLRQRGGRLIIREGDAAAELARLMDESGATAVYAEADITPYARQRDGRIAQELPLHLTDGLTIQPADAVRKENGDPYTVYTPFSKKWQSQPWRRALAPPPARIAVPDEVASLPLPTEPALPASLPFAPGETAAHELLDRFTAGPIDQYSDDRNRMDLDGTSSLSPYLRFGMISAQTAATAAAQAIEDAPPGGAPNPTARKGAESWLNELIWREFYQMILYHFPDVLRQAFRPEMRQLPWENNEEWFAAWTAGQTGYPVVDAAMRQLNETGWMHNRARMIVASFLTKDLLIDWRWGERYFMQHLVDGDPAANNGGWQWTAGTGTDAAPYFRIFNPTLQGQKFDPNGDYVRRWRPELANLPANLIHEPAKMSAAQQRQYGCLIGRDYPAPLVNHREMRDKALNLYKQ